MAVFNPFSNLVTNNETKSEKNEKTEDLLISFTPAKFDTFVKILSFFDSAKSTDSIKIQENTIIQKYGTAVLSSDISSLFENQVINIEINQPKKYIKLFKNYRNNNNIDFIDDKSNNRYIVTNNEIKMFLPKQVKTEENSNEDSLMPDFTDSEGLYSVKIDKETAKQLLNLSADQNYVEYLIQDNKLKGINIPQTAIYLFNEYLNDPKTKNLDETNADLLLRTGVFLAIAADSYDINIGKLSNGNYFSFTDCNAGLVHINIFENLENSTGGTLI